MRSHAVVVLAALVGCSSDPPCGSTDLAASYQLVADGIDVEVATKPFTLRVRDGEGKTVLETSSPGEGYGPATWTTGEIEERAVPSPGYFSFTPVLDP